MACHCWGGSFFVIYRRYLKYLSKSTINCPGRSPPVRFFVADLIEKALSKRPKPRPTVRSVKLANPPCRRRDCGCAEAF